MPECHGPHCCYIDESTGRRCERAAEWQIEERGTTLSGADAGYTHACTEHVGSLLGHAGDPKVIGGRVMAVGYEVWPIGSE